MNAVVIGSGISGLTSAALLSQAGVDVQVFEQNPFIGGVTAFARKNGYCWENGPLLLGDFLPGERAHEILKSLGISLPVIQKDRGIEMPDFKLWHPKEYGGRFWRRERLKQLFPQDAKGIDAYYRFYENMMRVAYYGRLCEENNSLLHQLQLFWHWQKVKKFAPLDADTVTRHFFQSEEIRSLLTCILADTCTKPSEAPGLGVPFFNIETAFDKRIPLTLRGKQIFGGYCYFKGGVEKLVDALAGRIRALGGTIHTSTAVTKINVKDGQATGVTLADGSNIDADIVVASGGGREVFCDLLGLEHLDDTYRNAIENFRPMESVFMVHLGVDFDPMEFQASELCYYYRTYDIEKSVDDVRSGIYHEGKEGFLIYIPSAVSPEMAPEGRHCVTIYTICPDTLKEGDWNDLEEQYADTLVSFAEEQIPGLGAHTKERLIMSPVAFRKLTHLKKSAFGGLTLIRDAPAPAHVTPVKGLYFIGAQSESKGGVAGVLMGAKRAFDQIRELRT